LSSTQRMRRALVVAGLATLVACGGGSTVDEDPIDRGQKQELRVWRNPYRDVLWDSDIALLAQHHDHVAAKTTALRAYDAAGYAVVGLQDYSGVPALAYTLKYRIWPPEAFVAADVLGSFANLKLLLPNAEEVGNGALHATSPFLTEYVEFVAPGQARDLAKQQYSTEQELGELVTRLGGFPIMAHPWDPQNEYQGYTRYRGMEVYNAFAEVMRRRGTEYYVTQDRNAVMRSKWDITMRDRPETIGIAVNDHFGPDASLPADFADLKDSGKVVVFARDSSLAAYRTAFERGALLAVQDRSVPKGGWPQVARIGVVGTSITVATAARVRWIVDGAPDRESPTLDVATLRAGTRVVRAEVFDGDGSVVYTQGFAVRPVGDVDGDYDVDRDDRRLCARIADGDIAPVQQIDACGAG